MPLVPPMTEHIAAPHADHFWCSRSAVQLESIQLRILSPHLLAQWTDPQVASANRFKASRVASDAIAGDLHLGSRPNATDVLVHPSRNRYIAFVTDGLSCGHQLVPYRYFRMRRRVLLLLPAHRTRQPQPQSQLLVRWQSAASSSSQDWRRVVADFQRKANDTNASLQSKDVESVVRVCTQSNRIREAINAIHRGRSAVSRSH